MSKRKINKFKVFIVLIAFILFFMTVSGLGRFVYNTVKEGYLSSRKFYFTSNLLTTNGKTYSYENWDGEGVYVIDIDLFSQNNDLEQFDDDLPYTLVINYDDTDILCTPFQNKYKESTKGQVMDVYSYTDEVFGNDFIIPKETHHDQVRLYIKPNIDENGEDVKLDLGKEHKITVTAYTTNPYRKKLMAEFKFAINEVSYYIEDHIDQPYVIFNVRNVSNFPTNITVKFDNSILRVDMNDTLLATYANEPLGWRPQYDTLKKVTLDDKGYVTEFTFVMEEETSRDIKFYKTSDSNPLIEQHELSNIFTVVKEETESE